MPLVLHFVHESTDQKSSLLKEKAVTLVGLLAKRMGWKSYWDLLHRTIKSINRKPDLERVLVKLTCVILDSFHFEVPDIATSYTEAAENGLLVTQQKVDDTNKSSPPH